MSDIEKILRLTEMEEVACHIYELTIQRNGKPRGEWLEEALEFAERHLNHETQKEAPSQ